MHEQDVCGIKIAMKQLKLRVTAWPREYEPVGPTGDLEVKYKFGAHEMIKIEN
jgi:hypothetical protein